MYYLLMYDDEMGDCILHGTCENPDDYNAVMNNWKNQGVGFKLIKGEVVKEAAGIVFGDGEDIWEPIDDEFFDAPFFEDTYQEEDDWDNRYSPDVDRPY